MDTMELECPSCRTLLEIDIAFAGGVCRCSTCGTLMTVPADPQKEKAERLIRPDRPGEPAGATSTRPDAPPGGRPGRPESPAGAAAGSGVPARADRPAAPSQPVKQETVDAGIYTTESGRQVRITAQTAIPTAVKRKAIRIGIVGIFVIVMVSMVALVLAGMAIMMKPKTGDTRTDQQIAADIRKVQGNYDPEINPFLLTAPNVLGLELTDRTIVILDTSSQGRRWLSMAADAVGKGIEPAGEGTRFQLILARESAATAYPETLTPLNAANKQAIKDATLDARSIGQANLPAAVTMAMAAQPARVVLITGQDMDAARIKAITAELTREGTQSPQLDVIHLGDQPGAVAEAAAATGGMVVNLPVVRLSKWYQDWQDTQPLP